MNSETKKRRHDYAALKRKLFGRILLLAVCAILAVVVLRMLAYGRLAEWLVQRFSVLFRIDRESAINVYFFGIRKWFEILFAGIIILLIVIDFRVILNSIGRYLDEITDGIEKLQQPSAEIHLSPELSAVENQLRSVQQEQERREQRSQQTERRKNDLVIYSAHDIRTPLTSALGYLILLDGNPDLPAAERKKYTGIALEKTRELDGMLDELFEITRYNLHDITLEKAPVDLCSLLLQMKEELYPQLRAGNKQLQLDMDENLILDADVEKLARTFHNLLKNAIAYSAPDSSITVTAQSDGAALTFWLQNQCRPIPQEKLDHLFEPGFRLEEHRPDNSAGAGLGLAIAKEIVLLHGGSIYAENAENGIRFVVTLPKHDSMNP